MSDAENLLKLKKQLEEELHIVNGAIVLLGRNGSKAVKTVEKTAPLRGLEPEISKAEAFQQVLDGLDDKLFTRDDILASMERVTHGTVNENTLNGLMHKAQKRQKIVIVKKNVGRTPAKYRKVVTQH